MSTSYWSKYSIFKWGENSLDSRASAVSLLSSLITSPPVSRLHSYSSDHLTSALPSIILFSYPFVQSLSECCRVCVWERERESERERRERVWHCLRLLPVTTVKSWWSIVVIGDNIQGMAERRRESFSALPSPVSPSSTSLPSLSTYLYLLGTFIQIILSLLGILHQLGVPALLHLLLVLQVSHFLWLFFHLPAHTKTNTKPRNVIPMDTKLNT